MSQILSRLRQILFSRKSEQKLLSSFHFLRSRSMSSDSLPSTMNCSFIKNKQLIHSSTSLPSLLPSDILIRVRAAGVNRPDVLQRQGVYPPPPGHSIIPGLEVSGKIVAIGDDVEGWAVGNNVCALTNGGGYADFCAVPYTQCLPVPTSMDLISAGALPETFFTVWHNVFQQSNIFQEKLMNLKNIKQNQSKDTFTFLVHGGSSGIGTTAIQLAKAFGIDVITTAGSSEKCKFCEELGAISINYKNQEWDAEVMNITNGEGVDLILDMVGGSYIQKGLCCLKIDGRLALIGSLGGPKGEIDFRMMMRKRLTLGGSTIRARSSYIKEKIAHELLTYVWPLIESNNILPVVDSIFPLHEATKAHKLMESSTHMGKIILRANDDFF